MLFLTEADVAGLLDMGEAIAALEAGLGEEAKGGARNMVKTHVLWGEGHTLHAIGAVFPRRAFACTKTWAHTGSANPHLILFDAHDGQARALIEAFALGQLRTGGISGLATRWLSRPDADEMGLIGSGPQALTQLAAVAAVRRLQRVRVFSPTQEHREAFCRRAGQELDLRVEPVSSVEAAVKDAPIVTLVTRAQQPILHAAMLARGTHVNPVGAISPERQEFAADLLARCTGIACDDAPTVRALSRELIDAWRDDERQWARLVPLSAVIAAGAPRRNDADLTLFKAMGMGISDLSLAIEIFARAGARGVGQALPPTTRARPRLKSGVAAAAGG
jgi:ornithine cyclodeaminase